MDNIFRTMSLPQLLALKRKIKKTFVTKQRAEDIREINKQIKLIKNKPKINTSIRDIMTNRPHAQEYLKYRANNAL